MEQAESTRLYKGTSIKQEIPEPELVISQQSFGAMKIKETTGAPNQQWITIAKSPNEKYSMKKTPDCQKCAKKFRGFTLTETLVSVAIAGHSGAISTPSYIEPISKAAKSRSSDSRTHYTGIKLLMMNLETPARRWSDLDKIATIMTINGPATNSDFKPENLPRVATTESRQLTMEMIRYNSKDQSKHTH